MLDTLRKGAASWVAKIFIGLLVISFAVWGIADIFRGYGGDTLAKVGETEISQEEFRFSYQNEIRNFSRRFRQQITSEQARALGIDTRVLSLLIGGAAMDAHAKELRMGISEQVVAQDIADTPAFKNLQGRFDRNRFEQVLQAAGLSEQGYIAREKRQAVRNQLTSTITSDVFPSQTLITALDNYLKTTRTLQYFVLPASSLGEMEAPTEAQLKTYYEGHKPAFTAPEFRKLGMLLLSPDTIKDTVEVSDEDVKAAYEARKDSFGTPERRQLQQISFPNVKAASEARKSITSGEDFLKVAKDRGLNDKDIDLGTVTKSGMADKKIAEAAFSLKPDEISQPIEGQFVTAILRVVKIEPGVVKTFDDVKGEVRDTVAKDRARDEILDIHDNVEDARAAGTTLAEAAQKLNLTFREIEAVDNQGRGPDGKPIEDLPGGATILKAAFDSDVGIENDPVEIGDGGFVWYDVVAVTPEKLKPMESVTEELKAAWTNDQQSNKLAAKAQDMVKRIGNGTAFETLAQEVGTAVKTSKPLTRTGSEEDLPQSAIAQAFVLPEGGAGSARTTDGSGRVVFRVTAIATPKEISEKDGDKYSERLAQQMADDFVSQYVAGLRDHYGVQVNDALFNTLTGRQEP